MKLTKYLLSALIVFCFAIPSASVFANDVSSYFIRPENFDLTSDWNTFAAPQTETTAITGRYINSSVRDAETSATIYVNKESTYKVWVLIKENGDGVKAYATVAVDGEEDVAQFGSSISEGYMWSVGEGSYRLTPGKHTITLKVGQPSLSCAGIFLTDDENFILNEETLYSDIEQFADTQPPVFENDIVITDTEGNPNSITVLFPEALDNSSVEKYEYYLDGELIEVGEDRTYTAVNLMPLKTHTFKVVAIDSMNNKAVAESTKNHFDYTLSIESLEDAFGRIIDDLSQLSSEQEIINVEFRCDKLINEIARPRLFVGIYTKRGDKMVAFKDGRLDMRVVSSVTASWAVNLPEEVRSNPDNYMIKAILCDDNINIKPLTSGVKITDSEEVFE